MDCRLKINKDKNRCKNLRKINGIPKKDLKWKAAKLKYPKLSPKGDADSDKKKNKKDCRPFDKKRHYDSWSIPDYGDISVSPRIYKAYEMISYGREMGLPGIETHRELKSHGFTSDEMRSAMSLYNDSLQGKKVVAYGY